MNRSFGDVHQLSTGPSRPRSPSTMLSTNSLGVTPASLGLGLDLLAVLVRAGEEHDVLAPQAVIPGQRVRGHRTVGVADVELVRGIVDGRCDIEFFLSNGILSFKTAAPNGRATGICLNYYYSLKIQKIQGKMRKRAVTQAASPRGDCIFRKIPIQ